MFIIYLFELITILLRYLFTYCYYLISYHYYYSLVVVDGCTYKF